MRRRTMCGMMVGVVGGVLFAPFASVGANDEWCWDDPKASFFDTVLDIEVQVPLHQRQNIEHVALTVLLPEGVPVTASPVSGNFYPMTFATGTLPGERRRTWKKGDHVPVAIHVSVNMKTDMPIRLAVKLNNVMHSDRTYHGSRADRPNHATQQNDQLSITQELVVPT